MYYETIPVRKYRLSKMM